MAYADYAFYTGVYKGTVIAESCFVPLAARASEQVDYLTRWRAGGYLAAHPEDVQVKKATCAIAELLYQNERGNSLLSGERPVQSEAVGKHHITYAAQVDTASAAGQQAISSAVAAAARTHLLPTGLLYAGAQLW